MTVWVFFLPFIVALAIASGLGAWKELRRGSREVLLRSDPARARATVDYYVRVQDSLAG